MIIRVYRKFYNFLPSGNFLRSSAITFIANIVVAIFNYLTLIFAIRILGEGGSKDWASIASILSILSVFIGGVNTEFAKRVSEISKRNEKLAFAYFYEMKSGFIKSTIVFTILSPILIFLSNNFFPGEGFTIPVFLFLNFVFQFFAWFVSRFLMGILSIKHFSSNLIILGFSRFIITFVFLKLDFEVMSLLMGWIGASLLSFSHAYYHILKKGKKLGINSSRFKNSQKFTFKNEIPSLSKTVFASIVLNSIFMILPFISEKVFIDKNADLFVVIYTFGQIIHFGSVSFLSLVVTFTARDKNLKMYLFSLVIAIGTTLLIGLGFILFGPFLLKILNRSNYIDDLGLIFLFSIFVAFYNIVYITGSYLIGAGESKILKPLFWFLLLMVFSLFNVEHLAISPNPVINFMLISLISVMFCSFYIIFKVIRNSKNLFNAEEVNT